MSFNIEWTNADALTPNPFTVTKDGLSYRVELDAHYISDEEMQTLRRYIADLNDENAKLREELSKWERLAAGIDLPEHPVTQFKPKDLERENAELRELLADVFRDFVCCDMALREHGRTYLAYTRYIDRMRELGVDDG